MTAAPVHAGAVFVVRDVCQIDCPVPEGLSGGVLSCVGCTPFVLAAFVLQSATTGTSSPFSFTHNKGIANAELEGFLQRHAHAASCPALQPGDERMHTHGCKRDTTCS